MSAPVRFRSGLGSDAVVVEVRDPRWAALLPAAFGVEVVPDDRAAGPLAVVEVAPDPDFPSVTRVQGPSGATGCTEAAEVVRAVCDEIERVVAAATPFPLVHAGAVRAPDGAGALLLGGSGAGKSTLVAAAPDAGLERLTDELVAIDRDLALRPLVRPLHLRPPGPPGGVGPGRTHTSASVVVVDAPAGVEEVLRAGVVAVLARGPACPHGRGDGAHVDPLPAAAVARELVSHGYNVARRGLDGIEVLAAFAATVDGVRLCYREAVDAAALLARTLAGVVRRSPTRPVRRRVRDLDAVAWWLGDSLLVAGADAAWVAAVVDLPVPEGPGAVTLPIEVLADLGRRSRR